MTVGRSRSSILSDLIGALSLTGLMIPESIAYSSIAGLPAAFGVTAAVVGPLAYSLIGRSRLAVVSATSGAAALLAAAIANASISGVPRQDCAIGLTALVGLFFLLCAVLRLGALTSFISRAVLHGFALGLAITICARQLPGLLGFEGTNGSPWKTLASVLTHFHQIHWASAILGTGALLFLGVSRRLKFAAAGLVLISATTLAMHFGLAANLGIATAGSIVIQPTLPHVPAIQFKDWLRLAQLAFPIAIVILAESWATIRSLAALRGDPVSPGREIAALGLANTATALLRGLPVGAGFSVSNANAQAGTMTRIGAVFAAIAVAAMVYSVAGWIALIPQPVLAAVVISALTHALSPKPIIALIRLDRDQWLAIAAALGVLLFGIIDGLLIAVSLSILALLRRLAYPQLSELGRMGAHDFVDCAMHPQASRTSGILVIRPNAPLFFANAESVLGEIGKRARAVDAKRIVLSLEETDDLDSSTLEAISEFNQTMTAEARSLILARAHDRVRMILERGGLADLAATSTFSVDDAVQAAGRGSGSSNAIR